MKKVGLVLASFISLAPLLMPALVSADVNDFTVKGFRSDQTLTRADPQGELHIVEKIAVDFTDNNHGILRAIPQRYKDHSLQIKINNVSSETGAPSQYTTYASNGNEVLKIGDPNRTVTGGQLYTIDYTVRNVISFYKDHDELYWDVNGDQWQQMFEHVTVQLNLPADLIMNHVPACYTGSYGSTLQNCGTATQGRATQVSDRAFEVFSTAPLQSGQTLTYVTSFSKGYFHPASSLETVGEYAKQIAGLILPILLIGGLAARNWWRNGRDVKGTGIIVPQYDAPDGLKPLESGAIMDFGVDTRDITATIINLAVRGYIRILEEKKDRMIGKDKLSYSLVLLNPDITGLNTHEALLVSKLFPSLQKDVAVSLDKSSGELYEAAYSLRSGVKDVLKTAGYFRDRSLSGAKVLKAIVFLLGLVILVALGSTLLSGLVLVGAVIGVLIALGFWAAMDARTAKGTAAKEHLEGLKLYLNVAEKDRIAKLQAPNAAYAASGPEPVKTVALFEKLLPYAIVLQVENQWAQQFQSLYTTPPDWYSGNWSTFNAYYLASSLNSGIGAAVNTAFSPPSSSGSSGFGGGGFSGGGGGGGGGGW